VLKRAKAYAEESLQWLLDDAVCAQIEVVAERGGLDQLTLEVICFKPDGTQELSARFQDVWG